MNTKKTFLLIAMLAVSLASWSQILWRVSGNDARQPSYILGTHHFTDKSFINGVDSLVTALEGSRVLYSELDLAPDKMYSTAVTLSRQAMAPSDSTLDKVLDPQVYMLLDSLLQASSGEMFNAALLNGFKPAYINTILVSTMGQAPSADKDGLMDIALQRMARNSNIEVRALESAEQQANILLGASIADQASALTNTVNNFKSQVQYYDALTRAYEARDFRTLEKMVSDPAAMSQSERERLLWYRNIAWADILDPELKEGRVFIAVGAAHLTGPLSVIERLRKIGYEVNPVK